MAIKETITIDDVIEVLNRAVKKDPDGMARLMNTRVECNSVIANDETIQVRSIPKRGSVHATMDEMEFVEVDGGVTYLVGPMGLINGLFGIDDRTRFGAIVSEWDIGCATCNPSKEAIEKSNGICPVCHRKMGYTILSGFKRADQSSLPTQE